MEKEKDRSREIKAFIRILDIIDTLRVQCPWDRKQTMTSLRPQTIEEVYELSEAIMDNDYKNVSKELGDVLLHILFYSKIGKEQSAFDIADVMNQLSEKLIYRHPHVYGAQASEDAKKKGMTHVNSAEEVLNNWEELKTKEKDGNKRVLSGVPRALPPLLKAYRMQDKAHGVGFDWAEKEQVWEKVREEVGEFEAEMRNISSQNKIQGNGASDDLKQSYKDRAEMEYGDLLFSLVNIGRHYKINPDTALQKSSEKFRKRFTYVEEHSIRQGKSLKDMSLEQMDVLWNEAKKEENGD